jgi:hypothetical protein
VVRFVVAVARALGDVGVWDEEERIDGINVSISSSTREWIHRFILSCLFSSKR